ncbi:MAG: short-chain dehydrogenase, partial [Thermoplasmata archaeon]|nr:short-chain dehydrogenase [Thermoplasmata archaeon]
GRMHFDDLEAEGWFAGFRAYGQSKLALLLLTYEYARRLEGTGVSVHAVHPGFVRTRFGRNNPGAFGRGLAFAETLFGVGAVRGARAPLFAATDAGAGRSTGQYFVGRRPVRSSAASYDAGAGRRLWDICSRVTGVEPLGPAA